MKFMKKIGIVLCVSLSILAVGHSASASVSLEEFESLRQEFVRYMTPWVKVVFPSLNRDLHIVIKWGDERPYAVSGIYVSGGLARLPFMTKDALSFILCHEIGHSRDLTDYYVGKGLTYGGEEIRADYFAAGSCLPHILQERWQERQKRQESQEPQTSQTSHEPPAIDSVLHGEALAKIPAATVRACEEQKRMSPEICLQVASAIQTTMDFMYFGVFRDFYESQGLPPPSPDRTWINDLDFIQCRYDSALRALVGQAPLTCKDLPPSTKGRSTLTHSLRLHRTHEG